MNWNQKLCKITIKNLAQFLKEKEWKKKQNNTPKPTSPQNNCRENTEFASIFMSWIKIMFTDSVFFSAVKFSVWL